MKTDNDFVKNCVLTKDEKILWEGRPRKIQFFESPHTIFTAICWGIALVLFAMAMKYWAYSATITVSHNVRNFSTIFLMLIGTLVALHPYNSVRNLEKNVHYIITDSRIIAYRQKNYDHAFIQSRKFEDITEATIINKENGMGDLYIGPMTKAIVRAGRKDLPPVVREEDYMLPMVLYNFYQPYKAARFLPSFIKVNNMPDTPEKPDDNLLKSA